MSSTGQTALSTTLKIRPVSACSLRSPGSFAGEREQTYAQQTCFTHLKCNCDFHRNAVTDLKANPC